MALYMYQGFSKDGKKLSGQLDAPSEGGVRELLQRQGIYPTSIVLAHTVVAKGSFFSNLFATKVTLKEKLLFTKQLAVLLRAGVPLLQALDLLDDQFTGKLHTILVSIKDGIKEGNSLADGLKRYPQTFENIYVQLVRAGEASGKLEMILDRLVIYLESKEALSKKVSSALRGPLIQLGIIFAVTIFLVTNVVPTLASSFTQAGGAQLPLPTQILMSISDFMISHFLLLTIFVLTSSVGFLYWKSTEQGAFQLDRLTLQLPIFGFFSRMNAITQFSSTLGMLLEAGVRLSDALTIVCDIVDNRVLKVALEQAKDKIIKQGKIAQYLKQTNIFPPIATYLISTGEESGNLDSMLLEVAKNYEKDLTETADGLSAALEPAMMFLMAVIVGFIVIAIALPMAKMGSVLS